LNPPPLITFAVNAEAAPTRHHLQQQRINSRILITGIGPHAARASITRALEPSRPPMVITCGFAGGLDPALPLGQLVFDADPAFPLAQALMPIGARPASFLASDRILATAADKAAARELSGADVVEMESFVIRQLCRERNIPSATLRVISDTAREDLPLDFSRFLSDSGAFRYDQLLAALFRAPGRIPALIRFQRQTRQAALTLAAGLGALLRVAD
jgi:adenosylhomocysteine nucleosidase